MFYTARGGDITENTLWRLTLLEASLHALMPALLEALEEAQDMLREVERTREKLRADVRERKEGDVPRET